MLSHLFLGMSLIGAEWVLYFLVLLSIVSVTIIFERVRFYRQASRELKEFRERVRAALLAGKRDEAAQIAQARVQGAATSSPDLESEMAATLLAHAAKQSAGRASHEVLSELARDSMVRAKLSWDRNLAVLATIGNNAPFIGLFGTVLGIIKAFHDLSHNAGGAQVVTAGISEALVATAVGLLVAIPAVVAFNFFQRKVKSALGQAEAMKSFLISKLAE